jgi:hypothetical protein
LENTSRRFGFLKKILTAYEQSHYKIFPLQWAMDEQLCIKFCTETKKDFTAILSKSSENVDVKLLIKTLKETTQLEAQLTKNFGSSNPVSVHLSIQLYSHSKASLIPRQILLIELSHLVLSHS